MSRLVDRSMMESVFDADQLVTVDGGALDGVPHELTGAYLRDVGLPDQLYVWFRLSRRLRAGEVVIGGEGCQRLADSYPGRPFDMSTWLAIGGVGDDDVAVDVVVGTVYAIPESGALPYVLNTDIQKFAYFLHALEVERLEYDGEAATDADIDEYDPEGAAERLISLMRETDPIVPLDNRESIWSKVLRWVESGMEYQ